MTFKPLPRKVRRVVVPPIKCQGIKTKLVDFILSNIVWNGYGIWVEPFLGSGSVLFNVQPDRARVNDSNPHIIQLYQQIYRGEITPSLVQKYLTAEGEKLSRLGGDYYYQVRERFNQDSNSLDFIFLNRSCFNGVMRFNRKGEFNVPFCRKTDRFRQGYVTKIANQVSTVARIMSGKDWQFSVGDWRQCLEGLSEDDFVYLDPPYIGRHTDYYNQWSEDDAVELAEVTRQLPCGVALSMWKENKYRVNQHLADHWGWAVERTYDHFYHVGSRESLRNAMVEALMIKPGHETETELLEITQQSFDSMLR